jgi:hypothetical protein
MFIVPQIPVSLGKDEIQGEVVYMAAYISFFCEKAGTRIGRI